MKYMSCVCEKRKEGGEGGEREGGKEGEKRKVEERGRGGRGVCE